MGFSFGTEVTGGMVVNQLVSWCWVKSPATSAAPVLVAIIQLGTLQTAGNKPEEGGDDVIIMPLMTWAHVLQWLVQRVQVGDGKLSLKPNLGRACNSGDRSRISTPRWAVERPFRRLRTT